MNKKHKIYLLKLISDDIEIQLELIKEYERLLSDIDLSQVQRTLFEKIMATAKKQVRLAEDTIEKLNGDKKI